MENGVFIKFLVGGFCTESIVTLSVFNYLCTLRFGLGVKGGLFVGGAPKMHIILGLSQAKHLQLGR